MRVMRRSILLATVLCLCAGVMGCGGSYESAWDEPTNGSTSGSEGGGATAGEDRDALIAAGEAGWAERGDEAQLRACVTAWSRALELDGTDADLWVRLAHAQYFLADGHLAFADDDTATQDMYQSAIRSSERALRVLSPEFAQRMAAGEPVPNAVGLLEANAVPALYWRASALGKWARRDGFATLLSFKDEIRAVMTRCMELDRYYFFAGPDRYFGAFFAIAPSYAGGDLVRSRQHFEESVRREPNYFGTHVLMAENLAVKLQDRAMFEEHLRYVIDGDPASLAGAEPENRVEQHKATELLARIDEFFE